MIKVVAQDDPIIIILRISAILIGFIIGIIMIPKIRKMELEGTKRYFLGACEFFIVYSVCRTVFLMGVLLEDPLDLNLTYYIGNTLGLVSIVLIIAAIESTIYTKSKHLFTIYGIVGIGLMVFDTFARIYFGTRTLTSIVQMIFMIPLGLVILLIYLNVTIKSTGAVRKNALIMFVAILLLMLSEMGNTGDAVALIGDLVYYISPIILVMSLILLYYSITHYFAE